MNMLNANRIGDIGMRACKTCSLVLSYLHTGGSSPLRYETSKLDENRVETITKIMVGILDDRQGVFCELYGIR